VTDSLTPYLILDPEDERGICNDFLTEAVSRFDEDDTVKTMLTKAFGGLSFRLSSMTMNDDYRPYVQVGLHIPSFPLKY
jgi:ubiquitin conjugation factor E4 B